MSGTIGGNCLALHVLGERGATSRWVLSAAVIVGLHAGAVAAALALQVPSPPPGSPTATAKSSKRRPICGRPSRCGAPANPH